MFPSNISLSATALFLIGSGAWVFISYLRSLKAPAVGGQNQTLRYFAFFLLGIGVASSIWALGSFLVESNPTLAGFTYPLGLLCGGIGLAYFTRVGVNLVIPRYEKLIFWLFMVGNILSAAAGFIDPVVPSRTAAGVVVWNISYSRGINVMFIGAAITIFNLALFSLEALKVKSRILKIRAIVICGALIFYMGGGLAHNIVATPGQTILADITTAVGAALILIAVRLPQLARQLKLIKNE